jgi:FdhE protein
VAVPTNLIQKLWGKRTPLPPEVEKALLELTRLGEQRPNLGPLVDQLQACLQATYAEPVRVAVPALTSESAQAKLSAGIPLLRDEPLEIDQAAFDRRWQRVVGAVKQHRPDAAPALAAALHPDKLHAAELMSIVLGGRPQSLHERAESLGLDVPLTASVLWVTLFPVLVPIRTALEPHLQATAWREGYCPVCGSFPKLGEFRGLEQFRWLRCGLCAAEWQFPRLRCPGCGQRDHRQLGYLHVDGEENKWRAAICEVCRQYVKMVSTLTPLSPLQLFVTDVATVHLDLLAADKGFSPPM